MGYPAGFMNIPHTNSANQNDYSITAMRATLNTRVQILYQHRESFKTAVNKVGMEDDGISPSTMWRWRTTIHLTRAIIIALMNAGGMPQSIRARERKPSKSVKDIRTQNISASMAHRWLTILQAIFISSVKRTDKMSA